MSGGALLQTQFSAWHKQYAHLSPPSIIIPLSDDLAAALSPLWAATFGPGGGRSASDPQRQVGAPAHHRLRAGYGSHRAGYCSYPAPMGCGCGAAATVVSAGPGQAQPQLLPRPVPPKRRWPPVAAPVAVAHVAAQPWLQLAPQLQQWWLPG